jgi:MFS family permease
MIMATELTTTNESVPAPSLAQQPSDNSDLWARIRPHLTHVSERIKGHIDLVPKLLFALWNISLLIGALIFIIYFASIGFMPEIDVTASVTLLTVSAITGAWLLISISLALVAPSYVWAKWTIPHEALKSLWSDEEGKHSPWRAALWFSLPLIGFIGGVFFVLVVGQQWGTVSFWGGAAISLIVAGVLLWIRLPDHLDWKQKGKALGIFSVSFLSSVFAFVPLILLVGIFIGASTDPHLHDYAVVFALLSLFIILWFNAVVLTFKPSSLQYIVVMAMLIFLFLLPLQGFTYIPKRVMNAYQFGFIPASLVLDDVGCMILRGHMSLGEPLPPEDKVSQTKTCWISDVTIHSRLGSIYYVQMNRSDNTPVCLTIPNQHVLSWSIGKPKEGTIWPPKPCI